MPSPLARAFEAKTSVDLPFGDEIYGFKDPSPRGKCRVLLSADAARAPGSKTSDLPLAWIQSVGKGRVFYLALGHSFEPYANRQMLQFIADGVQFALGDLAADATPQPTPKNESGK